MRVSTWCARVVAGWLLEGDGCVLDMEVVRGLVYLVGVGVWHMSKDCDCGSGCSGEERKGSDSLFPVGVVCSIPRCVCNTSSQ